MNDSPMRKPSPPDKKDSYHHGDLRNALLEAASDLIRERGAHGLTLRAVATRVGVSHTAPYRHFTDKMSLVAALSAEGIRGMTDAMRDEVATVEDPTPLVRYQLIGIAYVMYAYRNPEQFRVMFDDAVSDRERFPDVYEAKEECYQLLRSAIVDAQAMGTIRPRDPDEFALLSWSLVHGLSKLVLNGQTAPMNEEEIRELARNLTNGAYLGQRPVDR